MVAVKHLSMIIGNYIYTKSVFLGLGVAWFNKHVTSVIAWVEKYSYLV